MIGWQISNLFSKLKLKLNNAGVNHGLMVCIFMESMYKPGGLFSKT